MQATIFLLICVGMRILVTILLETAPMLGNVLILYAFVIHIFGVIGVQMWAGKLRNRCFLGDDILTYVNCFICSSKTFMFFLFSLGSTSF